MKKSLSLLLAAICLLSCMGIMAFADDAVANVTDNQVSVTNTFPDNITHNVNTNKECPYCGKMCVDGSDYAYHVNTCDKAAELVQGLASNNLRCYYCNMKFTQEKLLNEHYSVFCNVRGEVEGHENEMYPGAHVAHCKYYGNDYLDLDKDGSNGCPCTFNTKAQLAAHIAQCPYEGQYSKDGYLNLLKARIKDFFLNLFKNADWGGVLDGLKALVAGFDGDALKDSFNAAMGAADIDIKL